MDIFITVGVALVISIAAALFAIFTKKKLKKILLYTLFGTIVGLLIGYLLAPYILSFY